MGDRQPRDQTVGQKEGKGAILILPDTRMDISKADSLVVGLKEQVNILARGIDAYSTRVQTTWVLG